MAEANLQPFELTDFPVAAPNEVRQLYLPHFRLGLAFGPEFELHRQ